MKLEPLRTNSGVCDPQRENFANFLSENEREKIKQVILRTELLYAHLTVKEMLFN